MGSNRLALIIGRILNLCNCSISKTGFRFQEAEPVLFIGKNIGDGKGWSNVTDSEISKSSDSIFDLRDVGHVGEIEKQK